MKKVLAFVLVLSMIFAMCACGSQPAETTEKPTATQSTKPEETKGADPIKIGVYMPMTGSNAGSGLCQIQGIQMAMDEVNAEGGINGRKLEIITYDSTGTSEGAVKAATRLIEEDGVQVIIGSFLSANILAVSELTEKAKVLHVGAGTGASWTNIGLKYTYRATANGNLPVATMIEELIDCGFSSIALISVESDYGQSGHDAVVTGCEAKGIKVMADLTYQTGDTDFTGVITKALSSGAETIVVYGLGNELAMIAKQLRLNGYEDLIFTIEGGTNVEVLTVGGAAANGIVFAAAYVVPDAPENGATEMIREALNRFYNQYKEMPFSDCFYRGYDQGRLVAEALKNAKDVNSGESIKDAFVAIKGLELLGGTFDFTDGSGDGLTQANKWMIFDNKIQSYNKDVIMAFHESKK